MPKLKFFIIGITKVLVLVSIIVGLTALWPPLPILIMLGIFILALARA